MSERERQPGELAAGRGHQWKLIDLAFGARLCGGCGLTPWLSEGTGPCRGRVSWVCGMQGNAHTHGQCVKLFDSPGQASDHFVEEHLPTLPQVLEASGR